MSVCKRNEYLSWDQTFMSMAIVAGQRSKDPSTQVGCCIVNDKHFIVGIGYNGLPRGCSDDNFPWEKTGRYVDTKYAYIVHAEQNAILNSNQSSLENTTMYVTRHPCNECAKSIIQVGIKKVYYLTNPIPNDDCTVASVKMCEAAGVELIHLPIVNYDKMKECLVESYLKNE
jgi:dCMP deaminase